MTQANRSMIESMNILNLNENGAYKFLEDLLKNSQQWDYSPLQDRAIKKTGMHELSMEFYISLKLDTLTRKIEALGMSKAATPRKSVLLRSFNHTLFFSVDWH